MKIGVVCYPTFGGSGVVATELGKALAEKSHEVHFITYSQPVKLDFVSDKLFYHEVVVSDYPLFEYTPYELVLTSKLVDVAKHEKLDLLHVHYAIPHASAAYMARQILMTEGIYLPFITTLHGTDITLVGKDASFEPVITFAINQSDAVTAVSKSLKADTYNYFKIIRDIHVIPNFICLNKKRQADSLLKKQYAPCGEKVLIHVSNFRKVKRVEDVVKIFERVRHRVQSKLILIGDGPERYNTETLCRQMGLSSEVRFAGNQRFTDPFFSISDLFLLTSETESFGLAALEAMAMGVPVISSNTGGIPEVNKNDFSGYLCNVGDVETMAAKAIHILSSEERMKQFKANTLLQAEKFDIHKVLPEYEKLYEEVVSGSHSRQRSATPDR